MSSSPPPHVPPPSQARVGFPTTLWSQIVGGVGGAGGAGAATSAQRSAALETLIERYWQPVYCAVRFGWRLSIEDAKDATQSFFADLLERDVLADVSPDKGRLRAYLKAALKHFLLNRQRDAGRVRRGGGQRALPLDHAERLEASEGTPDEVLDEQWVGNVLARSVDALRRELVEGGKDEVWEAFRRYDLAHEGVTYAALARDLGWKESDVRNRLHAARLRLRAHVEREVGDYALDAEELGEELRWILS